MKKYFSPKNIRNYLIKRKIKNNNRFNIEWKDQNFNRIALVNLLLKHYENPDYLEIGCNENKLFDSVYIDNKIGVDPIRGGNIRLTSDEFFKNNKKKFDLIFIDGLHEYQQVRKDFINSYNSLKPNGYILLHDMHPRYIYEEYTPKINNTWTGDCWKLAYELSLQKYKMQIIMIDFGIGIFKNLGKKFELNDDNFKKIKKLDFNFFYENYKLFDTISLSEFKKAIKDKYN